MFSAVILGVVAWLVAMLLIDFAVMAYLYQPRKGKFRVGRDDDHAFTATTDFGRLAIDRRKRRLVVGDAEIDLAAIERLDYAWNAEWAFVEELFVGFDPWDVFDTYQDRVNWYQVSVVAAGSRRVPLFVIGQYEPKEPFTQWWFDWQIQVLERWGLYRDAEHQARQTLERLQAAFLRSGRELRLASAATKHAEQNS